MKTNFSHEFYRKIHKIAQSVGLKGEDLLLVMTLESGLQPTAHNPDGGASGLVQFMPKVLKTLNFTGTPEEFRSLKGEEQLDYIEKFVQQNAKFNGGNFKSAYQLYVSNFLPAALKLPGVKQENPNTIIVKQNPITPSLPNVSVNFERKIYKSNVGLDSDKDGTITYGDIINKINRAKSLSVYQNAVKQLHQALNSPNLPSVEEEIELHSRIPTSKPKDKFLEEVESLTSTKLDNVLDSLLKSIASDKTYIIFEKKNGSKVVKFASILSEILDTELKTKSAIFETNNHYLLEVNSNYNQDSLITMSEFLTHKSLKLFCKSFKIKPFNYLIKKANITPKVLDFEEEERQIRKFDLLQHLRHQ